MQDLHTRGKLLFSGNQGFTAGKLPDVMILFDKQARALQASGANLEIVFPSEGTVAFPVALLSKSLCIWIRPFYRQNCPKRSIKQIAT